MKEGIGKPVPFFVGSDISARIQVNLRQNVAKSGRDDGDVDFVQ
jgi:hypothetical protein